MWPLDLQSGLLGLSGLLLGLCLLLLLLIRRRPLSASLALLIFVPLSAVVVVVSQDLLAYQNLAEEERIASVFVARRADQSYVVQLTREAQAHTTVVTVHGDEWRLEGRVLRWTSSLAKLGLNNLVRLQRLSGRYRETADEQQQLRSVYPLDSDEWVDAWSMLKERPLVWQWVDVDFGSGVYGPLEDGALFGIYLGRSGMFVKPENPIAIRALQGW